MDTVSFVGVDISGNLVQPAISQKSAPIGVVEPVVVFNGVLQESDHGRFHHHCLRLAFFACASGRGGSDALQRPVELALT